WVFPGGGPSVLKHAQQESTMTSEPSSPTRRTLLAGAGVASLGLSVLAEPNTAEAIAAGGSSELRPFRVNIPQQRLDDLRRRILATQWPEKETVADTSQ